MKLESKSGDKAHRSFAEVPVMRKNNSSLTAKKLSTFTQKNVTTLINSKASRESLHRRKLKTAGNFNKSPSNPVKKYTPTNRTVYLPMEVKTIKKQGIS